MKTARRPDPARFTNADAIVCQLQIMRAGFTTAFANIEQFDVQDDETGIIRRCGLVAASLDWEIDQARARADRAAGPEVRLRLVR